MSCLRKCVEFVRMGYESGVCVCVGGDVCHEHCMEKMLLHKWTLQDKDFDIIIIKSKQHHMVRGKKAAQKQSN